MKCAICGQEIKDYGNNPYPVRTAEDAICCDDCNAEFVLPVRIMLIGAEPERVEIIAQNLNKHTLSELRELLTNVGK